MSRDELYKKPLTSVPDFEFNESVVAVFPDMIERSVPGYAANARLVVLNLVLQFIDPGKRLDLLRNLYSGLMNGGVLVVSEKVPSSKLFEEMHLEFKEARGYSALEIAQKRTALEAVMKLDPLDTHLNNLAQVGFKDVKVWFRYLNWVSILAIK